MEKAAGSVHICQDGWNVGAVHQTEAALPRAEIAEPESSSPEHRWPVGLSQHDLVKVKAVNAE